MHDITTHRRDAIMQLIFLIWPVLFLPILVAWLTRPRRQSAMRSPAHKTATNAAPAMAPALPPTQSPAYRQQAQRAYLEMQQLARDERRRESPAYRQAAQSAYQEMQTLADEEAPPLPPQSSRRLPAAKKTVIRHQQAGYVRFNTEPRQPLTRIG